MSNQNNIIPFPGTSLTAQAMAANAAAQQAAVGTSPGSDLDATWMARRIWNVRYDKTMNADQKFRVIYTFIADYENKRPPISCAWLRVGESNNPYFYEKHPGRPRIMPIDQGSKEFAAYLWDTYRLNSSEPLTKHLINALRLGAVASGLPRQIRRFSYWDRPSKTLYISSYDGYCWKITGKADPLQGVISVPNGSGPALFIDDDRGSSPKEVLLGNHRELFKNLIDDLQYMPATDGGMSPEIQRTCLGIWMFAIAFPDLMPTKPLLLVVADRGSGKTVCLQRFALALHGKHMPIQVSKKEDPDFGVKILRSPIAILDDINEPVDWLRDTLCTYATGGGWTRRALYTDDAEHIIKPESFLTITTNNPSTFRQSQVADRCLIIKLERREDKAGYIGVDALFEKLRTDRDEIFGEWLTWLNEIVAELRRNPRVKPTRSRMADFAHLAHIIARVLARPGGPPGNWSPEAVDEMLECMQHERDVLVTEGDWLIDLIDKWLEVASNQGREVRVSDLHRELGNLARAQGVVNFYLTPNKLAYRLREIQTAMGQHFVVAKRQGAGNVALFTFTRA